MRAAEEAGTAIRSASAAASSPNGVVTVVPLRESSGPGRLGVVAKISGEAMRITAAQKLTEARMSRTAVMRGTRRHRGDGARTAAKRSTGHAAIPAAG